MGFEQTVDNAVNGFIMWALQFEIINSKQFLKICLRFQGRCGSLLIGRWEARVVP